MKFLYYTSLLLYCFSHFCFFSPQFTGLEIDFTVWTDMLQQRIPDDEHALLFTIRGLVNILVLLLYFLSNQRLYFRLQGFLDLGFLMILIGFCLLLLMGYLLFFAETSLAFGALLWAFSAFSVYASLYQWIKTTTQYAAMKPIDHLIATELH